MGVRQAICDEVNRVTHVVGGNDAVAQLLIQSIAKGATFEESWRRWKIDAAADGAEFWAGITRLARRRAP